MAADELCSRRDVIFEPDRSSYPFGCKEPRLVGRGSIATVASVCLDRRCEYVGAVGRVSGVRLNVERQEGVEVAP